MVSIIWLCSVIVFLYMSAWFVVSLILKRNDVADLAWGIGFIAIAWFFFWRTGIAIDHLTLIAVCISFWGLRLASHIFARLRSRGEDARYLQWRHDWGKDFLVRSYLQVFLLQGLFMVMISMSTLVAANTRYMTLDVFAVLGFAVWLAGFLIESIADKQLSDFVHNPENKGKLMQSGLWNYSRHPNYFGEVTQWWGLFLIVVSLPYGLWALVSPVTITVLILFISGVPLLEKKYAGRADFEEYKRTTSVFVPWFKKY